MDTHIIEVVAAVIVREGKILVCSRPKKSALGMYWEFPGGKIEPGETPREALIREIREELSCRIVPGACFWRIEHRYPDKFVRVSFFFAKPADGNFDPSPQDGQDMRWAEAEELASIPFLPADLPVADALLFFKKIHKLPE